MSMPLKVVHCLRAPIGGLFRHVCDLVRGQSARGMDVGIICDTTRAEPLYEDMLGEVTAMCALGVHRRPMSRNIAPSDITTALAVRALCRSLRADVVHGHGAKGGAFARFAAAGGVVRAFYTPHGGSLHYSANRPGGFVFLTVERLLARVSDGLVFESDYGLETYRRKVGAPPCPVQVIHNGIAEAEFEPATLEENASDFLFIGELRELKGLETLLQALRHWPSDNRPSATLVGSGPDAGHFRQLAGDLGLGHQVRFLDPMPARQAFALGRVLVVPSLAESFPYIVLEALAAGKPVVATEVGGIPEMFGAHHALLVPPGDPVRLATAMEGALSRPDAMRETCRDLQEFVRSRFGLEAMVDAVCAFYMSAGCEDARTAQGVPGQRSATR